MPLEEEMKLEIRRLENEVALIDAELDKLNFKMAELVKIRQKKDHDLRVLRYNFFPELDKERQSTLVGLIKK